MTSLATDAGAGAEEAFRHEAFLYRDLDEFAAGTTAFVREGLEADESVLVALPPAGLHRLKDELDADADYVGFLDMHELGANPARIIPAWLSFTQEQVASGRGFRGIGEPLWVGRPESELAECHLHERLLNAAFDGGPAWRLLCPYDTGQLPPSEVAGALLSHPVWSGVGTQAASPGYESHHGAQAAFAQPLPAPPTGAVDRAFGVGDLVEIREEVARFARSHGVAEPRVEELVLAASELATNSVRYGGGRGLLERWREPEAIVVSFSDRGRITDMLAGRRHPSLAREGGRGLFLVNQLCDFVQVRSSREGTVVRVTTRL
ncbi:MAG: hypothetical protein QOJ03_667 [Frankiaceae bacterium]|jgi:anti-sigma regulatory factor (Ser/Thr protein kinase)|nr:hypothetical protein [Frankiaceae bacterium]